MVWYMQQLMYMFLIGAKTIFHLFVLKKKPITVLQFAQEQDM